MTAPAKVISVGKAPTVLALAKREGNLLIRQEGTDVLISVEGKTVLMPWELAEQVAALLYGQAQKAKKLHWQRIDKYHTGGVKVKEVLGMPVCTTFEQYERLGDLKVVR